MRRPGRARHRDAGRRRRAQRTRSRRCTDRPTLLAVAAERAVSRALGGNCSMPLAAHAAWQGGALELAPPSAIRSDATRRCCARARPARSATKPPPSRSARASPTHCARTVPRTYLGPPPAADAARGRRRDARRRSCARVHRHAAGGAGRGCGRAASRRAASTPWRLPLIEIAGLRRRGPLRDAWAGLARAVGSWCSSAPTPSQHFFAARPAGAGWPAGVAGRGAGPGHGRRAARRGRRRRRSIVEPAADAAQFDSEALWQRLRERRLARRPRPDRARRRRPRLAGRAARARPVPTSMRVAAYQRARADARRDAGAHVLDAAAGAPRGHALALQQLRGDRPPRGASAGGAAGWAALARASPPIRASRRARATGRLRRGARGRAPALDAVVACIQSMRP